jgi:hypothetical protein
MKNEVSETKGGKGRGRKTHDNHANETGHEARDLGETESDLKRVGEVDQGGNGIVGNKLRE